MHDSQVISQVRHGALHAHAYGAGSSALVFRRVFIERVFRSVRPFAIIAREQEQRLAEIVSGAENAALRVGNHY